MSIFFELGSKVDGSSVSAVASIISSLAWPTFAFAVLIWFRKQISTLIESTVEILKSSSSVRIWQFEFHRQVRTQLETSEAEARNAPIDPVGKTPRLALVEVNAANNVNRLVAEAPTPALKEDVLRSIREQMISFAQEYDSTRANMPSGFERTRAMNVIAAKMRTFGLAATPFLDELRNDQFSPGKRLAAICILQMAPDLRFVSWLCERVTVEQPFIFYQASVALLNMARRFGSTNQEEISPFVEEAIEKLESFSGIPDRNTIQVLTLTLRELQPSSAVK